MFVPTFGGQIGIVGHLPRRLFYLAFQFMQIAFDFILCALCHAPGKASLRPEFQPATATCVPSLETKETKQMLWTIFVILLVLWFLGLVTSYTLGGMIHILLVLAVIVLVIQLFQGRRSIL